MNTSRFLDKPVRELSLLSEEDCDDLVTIAENLVLARVKEYQDGKQVDPTRWKICSKVDALVTYLERKEVNPPSTLPVSLMVVGALPGTLDDNMFGLVSPTLLDMRMKSSYLQDCQGAAIVATIAAPTEDEPFRSVVIKWMEIHTPGASLGIVSNRDDVYLETTGILSLPNRERVGYHLLHSVRLPQVHSLPHRVRGNISFCGIFHQDGPDRNDCHGTGIMDAAGDATRLLAMMGMVHATMAGVKSSDCGQMKKLAWLLEQRYAETRHTDAAQAASLLTADSTCVTCCKPINMLRLALGKAKTTCQLCGRALCHACKLSRKLTFLHSNLDLVQRKVHTFCLECLNDATHVDTLDAARHPFVYKSSFRHSDVVFIQGGLAVCLSMDQARSHLPSYSIRAWSIDSSCSWDGLSAISPSWNVRGKQ
ncbi:hypothetical protein PsorP6_010371 [Peronosclerospora sorghi]|uniref:Uncharacterized protein n=1 Tax=Peronosclerospora sorghi TaxID=230839 RepID=A0ACC0W001_9STRA|nr:hypothetical protein PsorP6_010371 [Peronosclerospora sorghi]